METHILVTNNDGVFVPDRNWSGGGHVKTLDGALCVKEFRWADGIQAFTGDRVPSEG